MAYAHPENWRARSGWQTLEPYHALIYFAPEARTHYQAIGLRGFWMGYFASRAAAMGRVNGQVVAASFYNFQPQMVIRAIPDAWNFAAPEQVSAARLQAVDEALGRLLPLQIHAPEIAEAAAFAREAVEACSLAGRPLFAAHLSLLWPDLPHLRLWHAITLLREYRGDGHVIALLAAEIDGCEAHLTLSGTGKVPREILQNNRGWSDADWLGARQRLLARGLLREDGTLSAEGFRLRQEIEDHTDSLALAPWLALGEEKYARLLTIMKPISHMIIDAGGIPMPNPMGVPRP